jgi:transposase
MPSSAVCDDLQSIAFPHLAVDVEQVYLQDGLVRIAARTRGKTSPACPDCTAPSRRVHSRYQRHLADIALGGRPVVIDLTVRRLFCDEPACPRRTFVEQVEGLTVRYGRSTALLRRLLQAVGLALAGCAGARLLQVLHIVVSRVTLLSLVKALPEPPIICPRVLGVDDFALKRSRIYGTILIDAVSHRPVDLLPDREADTLATWLIAHPGAQIICRDRAGAYAEGARTGAPEALQVVDRWHLWHNLGEAVERCVAAHRACLRDPQSPGTPVQPAVPAVITPAPDAHRFADRLRERHAAVHGLLDAGYGIRATARQLRMGHHTVQRYARAATWQQMLHGQWQNRPSMLDPFKEYLHARWAEGITNALALHREIRARGYPGGYGQVRDWLRHLRTRPGPVPPVPPTVRKVTGWIMGCPDGLSEDETQQLKAILARCPELDAARGLVHDFAAMLTGLHGERLPEWIAAVRGQDLPALHSFAQGLEKDRVAVVAGLTLPWSNGPTEGTVNRLKMIKRQMFGRAGFALLRKRVLLQEIGHAA